MVSLKMTFYAEIAQMFFFLLCFYVSIINKIVCLSLLNSLTIEIYVFLHTYVFFYFCGLTVNKVAGLTRNSKNFSAHKLNPRKCRSSCQEVLYNKKAFRKAAACKLPSKVGLLKKFAKFTGKHLCWSLFFNINKVTGSRPAALLQRNSSTGAFLCILRNF